MSTSVKNEELILWLLELGDYLNNWQEFFDADSVLTDAHSRQAWVENAEEIETHIQRAREFQNASFRFEDTLNQVRAVCFVLIVQLDREYDTYKKLSTFTPENNPDGPIITARALERLAQVLVSFHSRWCKTLEMTAGMIWAESNVPIPAYFPKRVFFEIWEYIRREPAFPSYLDIQHECQVSPVSVSNALQFFLENEWIEKIGSGYIVKEEYRLKKSTKRATEPRIVKE